LTKFLILYILATSKLYGHATDALKVIRLIEMRWFIVEAQ